MWWRLCVLACVLARVASAETIIKIDDAGPSAAIPAKGDFFLTGKTPAKTQGVFAILVRTGTPTWLFTWLPGVQRPRTCTELGAELGDPPPAQLEKLENDTATTATVWGKQTYDAKIRIWTPPKDTAKDAPKEAATGDGKPPDLPDFRIYFDDDGFISAGHSYCMFLYRVTRVEKDSGEADELLAEIVKSIEARIGDGKGKPTSLLIDSHFTPILSKRATQLNWEIAPQQLELDQVHTLFERIDDPEKQTQSLINMQQVPPLDGGAPLPASPPPVPSPSSPAVSPPAAPAPEARFVTFSVGRFDELASYEAKAVDVKSDPETKKAVLNEAASLGTALVSDAERIRDLLLNWKDAAPASGELLDIENASFAEADSAKPDSPPDESANPLGAAANAILGLLALHGDVDPEYKDDKLAGYVASRGAPKSVLVHIRYVAMLHGDRFRVVDDKHEHPLDLVKATDLPVPLGAWTLADVFQLARGQLRHGGVWYSPEAYLKQLNLDYKQGPDTAKNLARFRDELAELDALATALETAAASKAPRDRRAYALRELGRWFRSAQGSCKLELLHSHWQIGNPVLAAGHVPDLTCDSDRHGWASYAWRPDAKQPSNAVAQTPLAYLSRLIESYSASLDAWSKNRRAVVKSEQRVDPDTHPIPLRLEQTQETWFFSFVSPIIGYAVIEPTHGLGREVVTTPYAGFQIHVAPNPEHRPDLSGGRMFALELGANLGAGNFGPDNRFRGLGNVAPVFVGLTVHFIPYTGITAGGMFAEVRSTTVNAQSYDKRAFFYLGLSLDANIPELIRSKAGSTAKSSISLGK